MKWRRHKCIALKVNTSQLETFSTCNFEKGLKLRAAIRTDPMERGWVVESGFVTPEAYTSTLTRYLASAAPGCVAGAGYVGEH